MAKRREPDQERISRILGSKTAPCEPPTLGPFGALQAFMARGMAAQNAVDAEVERQAAREKRARKGKR